MDEKNLIDELVRCTEQKRTIELVKLLVPEANDRTAELYARWTEYPPDSFVDQAMDESSDIERMKLVEKKFPTADANERIEIFRQLPYTPLNNEQRLYRIRQLRFDAPKPPENKYLAEEEFSNEDWLTMPPEIKYMIRAMRQNPDLDPESAARLVVETKQKIPVRRDVKADKKSAREKSSHRINNYALHFSLETSYPERIKILLKLCGDDDSADDDVYDIYLTHLRSIADPNFHVKSLILVDAHFDALCEAEKNS